jgi:hypothetical protein
VLKIDGSFVVEMRRDPVDRAMVDSINRLAHRLGMRTVAEFVGDQDTLQALTAMGVDYAQGDYVGKATRIDQALRAEFRDDQLKRAVVLYLVDGLRPGTHRDLIDETARTFEQREAGTAALAERFVMRGRVAYVDARGRSDRYDKTDLLLRGQDRAEVSLVHETGMLTVAARYDSGWDFVTLLGLGGGMPTRVSVPEKRLSEVLRAINDAPSPRRQQA